MNRRQAQPARLLAHSSRLLRAACKPGSVRCSKCRTRTTCEDCGKTLPATPCGFWTRVGTDLCHQSRCESASPNVYCCKPWLTPVAQIVQLPPSEIAIQVRPRLSGIFRRPLRRRRPVL
jgi:hypothetical protein